MVEDSILHPFRVGQSNEHCSIHDNDTGRDCELVATAKVRFPDGEMPLCEVHASEITAGRPDLTVVPL